MNDGPTLPPTLYEEVTVVQALRAYGFDDTPSLWSGPMRTAK